MPPTTMMAVNGQPLNKKQMKQPQGGVGMARYWYCPADLSNGGLPEYECYLLFDCKPCKLSGYCL